MTSKRAAATPPTTRIEFWALLGLLIVESLFIIQYHVLVCNLPLADTLLLVCSLFYGFSSRGNSAGPLFQRVCGCVAFCAVHFVNITHALEMLTTFSDDTLDHQLEIEHLHEVEKGNSSGHSHDHVHLHDEAAGHEHMHDGHIPAPFVFVALVDLMLKLFLLFRSKLPDFGMALPFQMLLHSIATIAGIVVFTLQHAHITENIFVLEQIDPILGIVVALISYALIFPSFRQITPYMFADAPSFFDQDDFTDHLALKFSGVRVTHMHIFRIWPKSSFEAIIHINIAVDKTNAKWAEHLAVNRFAEVREYITDSLKEKGAEKVSIEPRFIDSNTAGTPFAEDHEWKGCVEPECRNEHRGCCSHTKKAATGNGHC